MNLSTGTAGIEGKGVRFIYLSGQPFQKINLTPFPLIVVADFADWLRWHWRGAGCQATIDLFQTDLLRDCRNGAYRAPATRKSKRPVSFVTGLNSAFNNGDLRQRV